MRSFWKRKHKMKARRMSIGLALVAFLAFLASGLAQAAVVTNTSAPMSFEFAFPNGDHVVIAGDLHIMTAVTTDAQDGMHVVMESNPQGLTGVSDSGVTYHGTGVKLFPVYNIRNATFPYELTEAITIDVIGDGPSNDATLHQIAHVTINANGETTVQFGWRWVTFGDDGPK
jgi:hypothetical protein